jgi:hypothetical protein
MLLSSHKYYLELVALFYLFILCLWGRCRLVDAPCLLAATRPNLFNRHRRESNRPPINSIKSTREWKYSDKLGYSGSDLKCRCDCGPAALAFEFMLAAGSKCTNRHCFMRACSSLPESLALLFDSKSRREFRVFPPGGTRPNNQSPRPASGRLAISKRQNRRRNRNKQMISLFFFFPRRQT